jgi:sarcosine oxidase subunit beta
MFGRYKPLWGERPRLKSSYDAVIIGGGLHGLATAYFLARDQGITDVAVLEKRFIGFGGAGRNTAIVRANQRTQENVPLYKEGLKLWQPESTAQRSGHECCADERCDGPVSRC